MYNNLPRLTPRLALVASFVRQGAKLADIGTDHAYLPVFLVNSGVCPSAIASDVREGPLERAKLTAHTFGAEKKIRFSLADGLAGISSTQADDIVIAGMGGELITEIILHCAWLKNPAKHIVLQPMTAQNELHDFLCENGFTIEKESVVTEKKGNKIYLVISAYYSGRKFKADPVFGICGTLPQGGENERDYMQRQAKVLLKKAAGLRASKCPDIAEAQSAEELARKIKKICENMTEGL